MPTENELRRRHGGVRVAARIRVKTDYLPARSEPFVKYWVHNGFVKVDSEKMSKSLGNFFTIREVTERYHRIALRWMLLGTHYRAPIATRGARAGGGFRSAVLRVPDASGRETSIPQAINERRSRHFDGSSSDTSAKKPKPPPGSPPRRWRWRRRRPNPSRTRWRMT